MEPPCKKKKQEESSRPSFLSLPDVIILNCLARISKSYYPKLSLVSKTFRSLILSTELKLERFHHKTSEAFFHICVQLPNRSFPSWFTLWIKPEEDKKKRKKTKSTFVQVPSSYAPREPCLWLRVGSDRYALRQYYPPSPFMFVQNIKHFDCRTAPSMTVARSNPGACVLDGKIYVVGGCAANESVKCWGEVFDTKTQTWEPLPDPGTELRFSRVIRKLQIIQGKIYVRSNEEKDSVSEKTECKEWKPVRGLSSSLNKSCRRGLIETVNLNGKLLVLWDKFALPGRHCHKKTICCALVALEKRQDGQVWGNVEWSNAVLTVPSSYAFLRSSIPCNELRLSKDSIIYENRGFNQ
ncbi:hypothetical protein Bca4012_022417 [Brassica carinata]